MAAKAKKKTVKKKAVRKKATRNVNQSGDRNKFKTTSAPILDVIPYERNPRKNEAAVAKVAVSLGEFGWRQPIVVDSEMVVIAGHTRLKAALLLGMDYVPIHIAEGLTPEQVKSYRLMDNRSGDEAEYDMDLLKIELGDLKADDFDMALTGFDGDELSEILADTDQDGLTDEDSTPDPPKDPITKPGDLWLLGEHRLLCGDSTSAVGLALLMDGAKADFCFTSPPYLAMRDYNGSDVSIDKISTFISAASPHCDFFAVNLGISRKDNEVNRYWDQYIVDAESAGLKLTSWNVWSRQGMGGSIANMSAMFPIEHEWVLVFGGSKERVARTKKNKSAGLHTGITNRQKDGTTKRVNPKKVQQKGRMGSIYVGCYATGSENHPAAFPVHFPEAYINACCPMGGNVFEPFCGSGTTLIAAHKTNRKCYAMEISPIYCDVIIQRWEEYTGKKATLSRPK